MASVPTDAASPSNLDKPRKPLRLWPGVVLLALLGLVRFGLPAVVPGTSVYGVLGGVAGGVAIVLWWLFFSRAPWAERLGAVALLAVAVVVTRPFLHESIATGAMGMLFFLLVVPGLSLALVLWAVISRRLATGPRFAALAVVLLLASGAWTLVRTGGFSGDFENDFAWRWSPTPEEQLLAQAADEPMLPPVVPATVETPATAEAAVVEEAPEAPPAQADAEPEAQEAASTTPASAAEWPGFRGPNRDGIYPGTRIETDWAASPPVALWRRAIGPGWSSFAVHGDRLYTQEQRGEDEVVSCYSATTGEPIWQHRDPARFWESNAGAGPRGTPTLDENRVYTLGATGIVNALNAADGTVVWSRNAADDTGAKLPYWGFSGSPLVLGERVLVAASGILVAYDRATGDRRWSSPDGGEGYSSPHRITLDGVEQVLLLNGAGVTSFAPDDGTVLWEHAWSGYPIVQPAQAPDGDLLISINQGSGLRRLAVTRAVEGSGGAGGAGGWTVEERWTSIKLKPYFDDFVIHEGHVYGFDGSILACIDLENGERQWKGGRYGNGQLILLPDQDVMLVLSEQGELALVRATPDAFTELARFPAIEGKTWNHPVLVGDRLLVRNDREMAAFRLSLAGD
jgi:outer membrane protein assembly factor BamB